MRTLLAVLLAALPIAAEDVLTGYRLPEARYHGPGEWRTAVEPVWVYAYPTLRVAYRASGLPPSDFAVLTLRPGSVGPVTPGAANPENPFVAGMPVPAVLARDLIADGKRHTLEIGLAGRMRTPQIDELRFALPAGGSLSVETLEFRGAADLLPCSGGAALPPGAAGLPATGGLPCGSFRATSLRGRESLHVPGNGRRGRTLYLSLFPHFAGVSAFAANQPPDKVRVKESAETADFLVKLRYSGGLEEEQYPLSVADRRHLLVNRKAALYALELDPRQALEEAVLEDRSSHAQFVLYGAALSDEAPPRTVEAPPVPAATAGAARHRPGVVLSHLLAGGPADTVQVRRTGSALEIRNRGAQARDLVVTWPRVSVHPGVAAEGIYYVFPRQGAVIGNQERTLEAGYDATFPLQFVDVFAPAAGSGAAVIVRDTEGRSKRFRLRKTGASVEIEVEYRVRLGAGETWRSPEADVLEHGGDWHEGFELYRKWVGSWYRPRGGRPGWLRSAWWARRDYPVGGSGKLFDVRRGRYTYEELIRDGAVFGGIDFIDISGWAMTESKGRVGDYRIELGGPEDLRRNVALGQRSGVPTGLYFEGYLIDRRSDVGLAQGGRWQMIDAQGKGAWWKGGEATEFFACPYAREWQRFLSGRVASIARDTGAGAIYLDEFGFGNKRCYSSAHGHAPGAETVPGETQMAREVRRALAAAGRSDTALYIEETPPDTSAPDYDAAFCYNLPHADRKQSPVKLNLWRFVFPDIRLWDMLSTGIDPRVLSAEDFRLSLWHGNGVWLKGHSNTWYGEDLLRFLRKAHGLLRKHEAAFNGTAEPLVASPDPWVAINRFSGGGATVYTLFNTSYRTARLAFAGRNTVLAPRDVEVLAVR